MVLIVNTTEDKGITSKLRQYAMDKGIEADIVEASDMKISHCIGCNHCWLDTPGECSVKDDYEVIIRKLLKADQMWVISNTALGFIDHKGKNVYDRILPILTMNLKFIKGQMRHIRRYDNRVDMGLIVTGECDKEYLRRWNERVALNVDSRALGVYDAEDTEEYVACMAGKR
jgi:multimeric flavodoxin WrbA